MGVRTKLDTSTLSGYYRQNVTLNFPKVFGRASARVLVGNLFDRRHADPSAEDVRGGEVVQDGRTALVTLSYHF